jgi:hypothetical protein
MGTYFTLYFSGAFLGPIMSGNISARHGWRSFFWLTVALAAFVTVLLVFAFPETKYHRGGTNHAGFKGQNKGESQVQEKTVDSEVASETLGGGNCVGRGRPNKMQFSPVQKPDSRWLSFVVRDILTPVIVFFNPIIFWAALMLAGPADLLLLFNLTESGLFSSPAYGWGPAAVGYSNFAFFIGGVVGVCTAGPLSDYLARRATIRNNGIREAEMRLPALIPYVCFFIVSHVVGAVGYQRLWPWQAILVCGFGFSGLVSIHRNTLKMEKEEKWRNCSLTCLSAGRHIHPNHLHRLRRRLLQAAQRRNHDRCHRPEKRPRLLPLVLDLPSPGTGRLDRGLHDAVRGVNVSRGAHDSLVLLWQEFEEMDEEFGFASHGSYDLRKEKMIEIMQCMDGCFMSCEVEWR